MKKSHIVSLLWSSTILSFIFILSQCDKTNPTVQCHPSDSRVVGIWKLTEECTCYSLGNFTWHGVSKNLTYSFDAQCIISERGDTNTSCNDGTYTILKDQINVIWNCASGNKSTNTYTYSFSPKNDTLILKGFVDDAYFGLKFYKHQGQ